MPRININTAPLEELIRLPKIGPVLAHKIIEDRAAQGFYKRTKDLLRIPGITENTLEALHGRLIFKIESSPVQGPSGISHNNLKQVKQPPGYKKPPGSLEEQPTGPNPRWLYEVIDQARQIKSAAKTKRKTKKKESGKKVPSSFARIKTEKLLEPDLLAAIANGLKVPKPHFDAVVECVTVPKGRINDGRAFLTLHGEMLWQELKKRGLKAKALRKNNEKVLYSKWTEEFTKKNAKEYDRLSRAMTIHPDLAMMSSSWGMFQVLGVHYKKLGYPTVYAFVQAQHTSEIRQLEDFIKLMRHKSFRKPLRKGDWEVFAEQYFGPGYKASGNLKSLKKTARQLVKKAG